tara:strand:- start:619 stop:4041 length:3423 start_codon:yes stop_codon:yes gene_type:complete
LGKKSNGEFDVDSAGSVDLGSMSGTLGDSSDFGDLLSELLGDSNASPEDVKKYLQEFKDGQWDSNWVIATPEGRKAASPESLAVGETDTLEVKHSDGDDQIPVQVTVTRSPDGGDLSDITGKLKDDKYKIYDIEAVNLYDSEDGLADEKTASDRILDSNPDISDEDLDSALDAARIEVLPAGKYALSDLAMSDLSDIRRMRLDPDLDSMSNVELNAVRSYVEGSTISNALRGLSDFRDSAMDSLKSALDKAISSFGVNKKGRVYRGVSLSSADWDKLSLKPGDRISDPGYMSTSTDFTTAKQFTNNPVKNVGVIYQLNLDGSSKALPVDGRFLPPDESEILLPRDLSFEVVSVEDVSGKKLVTLNQVPADSSVELDQGLPGVSDADTDLVQNRDLPDSVNDLINGVFDKLREDLKQIIPTRDIQVSNQDAPTVVSDSIKKNKSVIKNMMDRLLKRKDRSWSPGWAGKEIKELTAGGYRPFNPLTEQEFKSFNLLALGKEAKDKGYSDPRWMTAEQAEKLGGKLKDGEVPTTVAVPVLTKNVFENGNVLETVDFQEVTVFNAEQFESMPKYNAPKKPSYTFEEAFQLIIDRYKNGEEARASYRGIPNIFGKNADSGDGPAYRMRSGIETVEMPLREQFDTDTDYLSAIMHELLHSTGKYDRLDRERTSDRDSKAYAKEEAIVELATASLLERMGLTDGSDNSGNYVFTWIQDGGLTSGEIEQVGADALNAVEYILGNDVLPNWDPSVTKRYATATQVRNNSNTPLSSSINSDTSQSAIRSMDLTQGDMSMARATKGKTSAVSGSQNAIDKVLNGLRDALSDGFKNRPWRKPYKDGFEFTGGSSLPRNPFSKHIYSGTNSFVLRMIGNMRGYTDPRWMTYNQALEMKAQVRKGAKGVTLMAPRGFPKKDDNGKPILNSKGQPVQGIYFTTFTVFNVADIDGLDLPDDTATTTDMTPLEAQNFILDRYKKSMEAKGLATPKVVYSYVGEYGDHFSSSRSPNWSPGSDVVTLPQESQFTTPEEWFETLMHELVHSTGMQARLDRSDITNNYATDPAARGLEELIAEMGAATLGEMFGVNYDIENMTAYIESWQKAISQTDLSSLQVASSKAQQAVDYLLGIDLGDWSPLDGYSTTSSVRKTEGD